MSSDIEALSPESMSGGDCDPVQITTTIGSGPTKRKEVMTLPLPPGTLPPRKRAKTKDEKEQRRIERIMRNRQAAHASREKKRKHVEELEKKCVDLEADNLSLASQVQRLDAVKNLVLTKNSEMISKIGKLFDDIRSGDVKKIDSFDLSSCLISEEDLGDIQVSIPTPKREIKTEEIEHEVEDVRVDSVAPCDIADDEAQEGDIDNDEEDIMSTPKPDSLILSTFTAPSLSSSVSSSPLGSSSSDYDEYESNSALPPSEFVSLFEESSLTRSHHPAAVMSLIQDLQRRSATWMIRSLRILAPGV